MCATSSFVASGSTRQRYDQRSSLGGPHMATYAAPGETGSVVTFKPRYDNFIGGEFVAPVKGQYFENPTPVTGQTFTEIARGTAEDIELALDAAHGAAPAWGKTVGRRPGQHPDQDRGPDRGQPREDRHRRVLGQRQGLPGDAGRRHPAGHRPPALLRRRAARAGGRHLGDRREHRRLPLPRAARRRRADHPVELPDPDGDLEAGPGAGRGQRGGAQAGRADSGVDPGADGDSSATCCRPAC